MSTYRIEAFLSANENSANLNRLLNEINAERPGRLQIELLDEHSDRFKDYHLTSTPALVIEELVKMTGFCPSKESILAALSEVGMDDP